MSLEQPGRTTPRMAAYHEAGHAVASYFLPRAWGTARITIRRQDLDEDDAGAHFCLPPPLLAPDGTNADPEVVRANAVVGLAGIEVDRRLTGNAFTSGSSDAEEVRQRLREVFLAREIEDALAEASEKAVCPQDMDEIATRASEAVEDDLERLLDTLRAEARALIELHWPQVEAVAESLLEHGVLSGDEARRIIESVE